MLTALALALHHNARRHMRNTHCGAGLVHMLATRTTGPIKINAKILIVDFNIDIILKLRHAVQCRKTRMPTVLGIKWVLNPASLIQRAANTEQ